MNYERLTNRFIEMCKIWGEGKKEVGIANYVTNFFENLGYTVTVDDAHKQFGGDQGNIFIKIDGAIDKRAIMLSSHMDTVKTGGDVEPIINGEYIESRGDTILGADDRAGIAAIMEVVETIKEKSISHRPLFLAITVAEEIGLLGARYCNITSDDAEFGVILDTTGPIGKIVNSAPFHDSWKIEIKGKAAHAGISPEDGINAILIASKLIEKLPNGRIDFETTANVAQIRGGSANNIVPETVTIYGECRSLSRDKIEKLAEDIENSSKILAKETNSTIKFINEREYDGYSIDENSVVITELKKAAIAIGKEPVVMGTGGGSDANYFNQKGITSAVISCGMDRVHSNRERIKIRDLHDTADLVLALITQV